MYTDEIDEYIQVVKSELGYATDQDIVDKSVVKMIKEEAWKRMCDAEGVRGGEEFKKLPKRCLFACVHTCVCAFVCVCVHVL